MNLFNKQQNKVSRRLFIQQSGVSLGSIALAELLSKDQPSFATESQGLPTIPHFPPKAKRVIFLLQSGAPSQIDLFDEKPILREKHGTQLPESVRKGQRLTGMSGNQTSLPLVGSPFSFHQYGKSGAWVSELLPHTAKIVDELCFIKSLHTDSINHGPAVTFLQTGSPLAGRPSLGAWLSYGLGSENENLPNFVVLVTKDQKGQPLVSRFWGNGFLPSHHQGVRFRSGKDPILYLSNPAGINQSVRREMLDTLKALHEEQTSDPLLEARMAQYELAYRMQQSIPDVVNFQDESEETFQLYGEDSRTPGTYAANCLLARRLAEKGVRFIQLYHQGWDHHGGLPKSIKRQCKQTDQASAALVLDLKRRGLLEDTLVIWGGEFGRTNYCQGKLTATNFGRDHHPRCFTYWMAGGGIQPGKTYGNTDDFSYNVSENPVHVHDLQATILHLLGIDHKRLTYKYQGRRFRLTDVHGHVVKDILV
ncbi:Sulfatase [Planctomycetales bacterium 10988]|nr:Sulfatase [Planctomycetales bacterium 10988]